MFKSCSFKICSQLSIGFLVFGIFLIIIGIILRVVSASDSSYTTKTRLIASIVTVFGCTVIVIAGILLLIGLILKCNNKESISRSTKSPHCLPPLELSKEHNIENQLSGSVSTPGWSYHNNLKPINMDQLEKLLCPLQHQNESSL